VLVVDDEAGTADDLQRLLRPDGYRVLSVASAAAGLELLALHPVQVMICDPGSPVISDSDFLDRVKDLHPDMLRIVLSSRVDTDVIMTAINRGSIYRYFTKPFDDRALRIEIRNCFRHYWQLRDIWQDRHGGAQSEAVQSLPAQANGHTNGLAMGGTNGKSSADARRR
jgi:DNA-binding NtrC family response regulator